MKKHLFRGKHYEYKPHSITFGRWKSAANYCSNGANGEAVAGAFSSETITTADTELRTLVIDEYVMVDKTCVLGNSAIASKTIAFLNSGVASTLTSVVVNIDKVV